MRARAPGLDGVRAIAVLAVIGYHQGARALSGGFLGVDVFFVLSGFLITDLLVSQQPSWQALREFWVRRARRLLPALAVMLVVVTAAATIIEPAGGSELRPALLAAVTYTSNWYQMLHHVSYFASFGPLPPLEHLWSLAIEEQFYLIWPLVLWCIFIFAPNGRRACLTVALLGAAGSAVAMALLYTPDDPSLVYYGTGTHASALLIGAALALACPLAALARAGETMARRLDAIGIAGIAVLAWAIGHFSGTDAVVYPAGLLIAAIAAAAVVAAAASRGIVAAMSSLPPVRWIGVRSYAMYLWHWPVIALAGRAARSPWLWIAETAITVALAAASWQFIESPILHNGFRSSCRNWYRRVATAGSGPATALQRAVPAVAAAGALGVAVVAGYGVAGPVHPPVQTGLLQQVAEGEQISATSRQPAKAASQPAKAAKKPAKLTRAAGSSAQHAPSCRPIRISGRQVTAVGDSVMLASADALEHDLPGSYIDARVGMQMQTGVQIVQDLAAGDELRRFVVVGLGTNGAISAAEIGQLRQAAGPDRELILVNTFGPMPWKSEVNGTLAMVTWHKPRTELANWADAIAPHTALLWSDGIHPQPAGARLYAHVVAHAVRAAACELRVRS